MAVVPITVIEPRPCLPEGRIALVESLTGGLAARWGSSRRATELLVVLVVAGAAAGVRQPLALLVTVVCGVALVRSAARKEIVEGVLGPYVAALVGTFGVAGGEVLCDDLPKPARGDAPIQWALHEWRVRLESRAVRTECGFGQHALGCAHCPFSGDLSHVECWPAPFNRWLEGVRRDGVAA